MHEKPGCRAAGPSPIPVVSRGSCMQVQAAYGVYGVVWTFLDLRGLAGSGEGPAKPSEAQRGPARSSETNCGDQAPLAHGSG